jgi:hypothetical protein
MQMHRAPLAGIGRTARIMGAEQPPRFLVRLTLGYYVDSAGTWGTGVTCRISRRAVEFVTSGRLVNVGDVLHYVLVFPGSANKAGAVASCRGQVLAADATVVVTIDQYRLQTADTVRTARGDAWTRSLVDQCGAARLGCGVATAPAAATTLPA